MFLWRFSNVVLELHWRDGIWDRSPFLNQTCWDPGPAWWKSELKKTWNDEQEHENWFWFSVHPDAIWREMNSKCIFDSQETDILLQHASSSRQQSWCTAGSSNVQVDIWFAVERVSTTCIWFTFEFICAISSLHWCRLIEDLQSLGINVSDIKKLQDAGIHTIGGKIYNPN